MLLGDQAVPYGTGRVWKEQHSCAVLLRCTLFHLQALGMTDPCRSDFTSGTNAPRSQNPRTARLQRPTALIQSQPPAVCRSPTSSPGCPEPHPAWPWMPAGMGHHSLPVHRILTALPQLKRVGSLRPGILGRVAVGCDRLSEVAITSSKLNRSREG